MSSYLPCPYCTGITHSQLNCPYKKLMTHNPWGEDENTQPMFPPEAEQAVKLCCYCSREWCEALDAYTGKDSRKKGACIHCQRSIDKDDLTWGRRVTY